MSQKPSSQPDKPQVSPEKNVASKQLDSSKLDSKQLSQIPRTQEDQKFADQLDERTKKHLEKLEELKKNFDPTGSLGKAKVEQIFLRQANKIHQLKEQKLKEFQLLMQESKADRENMMLEEVEKKVAEIPENLKFAMDYVKSFDKIDNKELALIEAFLEGVSKLKTNPQAEELFKKLSNKENLTEQDYQNLINLITPADLNSASTPQLFEASQSGVLISLLSQEQKLALTSQLIQQKNPQDAEQIISAFITFQVISIAQINHLLETGKVPEPLNSSLTQKINTGKFNESINQYQQQIEQFAEKNASRTTDNLVWKTAGKPGLLALTGLWGAATMLANFSVNFDLSSPGESLKNILKNEYFWLGAGALGVSAAGILPTVAPKQYQKLKKEVKAVFSNEYKEQLSQEANQEIKGIATDILGRNPYLKKFLLEKDATTKFTGLDLLTAQIKTATREGKPTMAVFKELKEESGENQQLFLNRALGMANSNENYLNQEMTDLTMTLMALKLDTNDQLEEFIQQLNQEQGIS